MSLRHILFATSVALLALLIGVLTSHNHRRALPTSSTNSDHQYGLFVLAPGIDPIVDIIAIHGLDGHPRESWTAANGKLWLRDFLPDKIPNARIMSYGYNAYTRNRRQLSDMTIYDHAEALVAALASTREETKTQRRPIIFVAHSLGGIVLKYAMVHAHLSTINHKFHHRSVELSTYGINYLGTPHQGSDATDWATLLLGIQSIYSETNDAVLEDLRHHSPRLQQQLSQYSSISGNYKTKFFYETYDTFLLGGFKKRLVPKFSAVVPGATDAESIPLHKDHVGMAKFESDGDGDFQTIASHLFNMVKSAPSTIAERWESYDRHAEVSRKEQAGEEIMKSADAATLNKLPYADGASYIPEKGCLTGTRTALIDDILAWIKSVKRTKGAEIYYLSGGAGVGKSTIAHTVAQRCENEGWLTSSFFFDGQIAGRNSPAMLFSTIARNLADKNIAFRQQIVQALEERRSLAGAAILDHFKGLILRPSRSLRDDKPVVVIVDALDEGRADEVLHVLEVLRDEVLELPGSFRILLTSRMTPDINFYLADRPHVRRVSINTSEQTDLDDIAIYSQHKLRDIALRKDLGTDWPDPQLLRDFISKSGGLFVWVSVVYEHLRLSVNPDRQLRSLISTRNSPGSSPEIKMDTLYVDILKKCNWNDNDFIDGYHLIMGSIISAKTPLSMSALQSLHRHNLTFPIKHILAPLASLLIGVTDDNKPVQILHLSLKDFLTVRARSSPNSETFSLDEAQNSERLALLCLVVLNEDLGQTASAIGYLAEAESHGIPQIPGDLVSGQLLYACQFWVDHLVAVEHPGAELVDALRTFVLTHIVGWMELVTAMRQFDGLSKVRAWIERKLPSDAEMTSTINGHNLAQSLVHLGIRLSYMDREQEALTAAQESVELYRSLAKQDPTTFNSNLARALIIFANRLSDLGYREEALRAVEEAVEMRRSLAKGNPAAFNPDLAAALNDLAIKRSDLGYQEGAVRANKESVGLYRSFAKEHPTALIPDLAGLLNNLANRLSELGHREEALRANEEAVELYRSLAKEHPAAFNPNLAIALTGLSHCLSDLGYGEEAVRANEESVELYRSLAKEHLNPDLAGSLNNLADRFSQLGHREEALRAIKEAVELYRSLAIQRPAAFKPSLAMALAHLASVLSKVGNREEALKAIKEAVELYRSLATQRPAAFNPGLAKVISDLAVRLSDLGNSDEALSAVEEAIELYRSLAKQHPAAFTPNLAMALDNLSNRLSELGHREEALKAMKECVELFRSLAKQRPTAFNPDLATALNNLAGRLASLGHGEEELRVMKEAVKLRRSLAKEHPAAFNPDLAAALNNLANKLSELGHGEEALRAIREAIDLYRSLAMQRPAAFNPGLAAALTDLANRLSDLGYREKALRAIKEAVELRKSLAKEHPAAFNPNLAAAFNNLSIKLSDLGYQEEALRAIKESVKLYRSLAKEHPAAFNPDLAIGLSNLSTKLSQLGHREEALKVIEEAVELCRLLTKQRPAAFSPELAGALNNFAICLSDLGHQEEALRAVREAVKLYRSLTKQHPTAYNADLAGVLTNLAARLSDLGHREEALKANKEAVKLYRSLAKQRPITSNPGLAMALNSLATRLFDLEHREEALIANKEAVKLYRSLTKQHPAAFNPDLAAALNNLATRLFELGRREEALGVIKEAVELRRALAKQLPTAFNPVLAGSLQNLAIILSMLGRREESLRATKEAAELH